MSQSTSKETRFIFVTGGVCSSLGKGVASASLGCLLESRGLSVALQKLDPYINVDPGTMNPFQHGEVYVTDDGAETDLDLGYYERYTSTPVYSLSSVSTGQIYDAVIRRERRGGYLGQTVQVIPHVTDEIKLRIRQLAEKVQPDIQICEIGGTVGDIEGVPFLEAIRQFSLDVGRENALFIHLTLLPFLGAAGELKSKPTQHSVKELREIGIIPDLILCRTSKEITSDVRRKIALFSNLSADRVFSATDIKTSIYEIPELLHQQDLDGKVCELLKIDNPPPDLHQWNETVERIVHPDRGEVTIGLCGKYVDLQDSYRSIYEALVHGGSHHDVKVNIKRIDAEQLEHHPAEEILGDVQGILVPGGFGGRGFEGKIKAVEYARTQGVPYLGICYGMHAAVVEFSRHECGYEGANTTEIDKNTPHPVISLLHEQESVVDLGGTMRLGAFPCDLEKGTVAQKAYGETSISERHRHRYEFNNAYMDCLNNNGMKVAGRMPETGLVEIVEIPDHPWFVAVQFHPEFKSRPRRPHPLFRDFVGAAVQRRDDGGWAEGQQAGSVPQQAGGVN